MKAILSYSVAAIVLFVFSSVASAQAPGSAVTVTGTVVDPSGAAIPGASVELKNPLTGYLRSASTDTSGAFCFSEVPPNPYQLSVKADGFSDATRDVALRSSVPVVLKIALAIAAGSQTVNVEAAGSGLVENVPYAHNDVDRRIYETLPISSPGAALSDAITLSSPGVVADSNGFFHPLGDHAQTSFSVDGQPISDQQNKQFSTQIPLNAIQSMELITGAPTAEYGDKTSLVVNAVTRSGAGQKPFGSFVAQYGSFGTIGEDATLGFGGSKWGNFIAANSVRTGRFLDTPEFLPIHDAGNSETIFDRFDWLPDTNDAFHLNVIGARNWFQVPNSYDQLSQDQRQKVLSYDVAPGLQHTINASTLLTVNAFLRHDAVDYFPSSNPLNDFPASVSQHRTLTNWGMRADLSYVHGIHNVKVGTQLMQTRLDERFALGITDPLLAAQPGLAPLDLIARGTPFQFAGRANINEAAVYLEDTMTLGRLTLTPGLRIDRYDGLSKATGVEPRFGASYLLKPTHTVLRAAYSRTLETPYNENLILSSSTGSGGLAANIFGAYGAAPIQPGRRNQFNAGLEQQAGRFLQIEGDYFWKFTDNAFDFGTLLNSPIVFPISWRQSKIDGVSVRVSTTDIHGFQAYTTFGHTRARYFGPSNGGLIFNSPLDTGVFRIDHDQAFQQTANIVYHRPHNGPWAAFTWRYDSGMVAGAVTSLSDALALTAAQQAAIGFYCGGVSAALSTPITSCTSANYGATRLSIPAPGTFNADHNPPRIAPRNIFDVSVGTDNLFHVEKAHTTLKFMVANLTNNVALYNFLSTFSGTHFVEPRSYQLQMGFVF